MSEKISLAANKGKMKEFLDFLFEGMKGYEDGLIEISDLTRSLFFKLDEIESAVDLAYEWNTAGKCVYTTGALIVPDIYERIEKRREEDRQSGKEKPSYRATGNDFYTSQVCWVDIDGVKDKAELKKQYELAPPNYISITSKTPELRTHLWWMLSEASNQPEIIETVNIGLIACLGGDKGTHNRTRLMKIGGSVNWPSAAKSAKGRVPEIVECGHTQWMPPHDIEKLLSVYTAPKEQARLDVSQSHSPPVRSSLLNLSNDKEKALEALYHIPADCDYDTWYRVAAAAKRAGISYPEFLQWSATGGSKYEGPESVRKKWDQVSAITSINPGTLFYIAKEHGYETVKRTELTTHSKQVQSAERFDPETGEVIEITNQLRNGLYYIPGPEIEFSLESNEFVQDLLTHGGMSVIYGESNCGKTFFATDLAFHIAEGQKWNGKRVDPGSVLYVVLEGSHGLRNRVEAYRRKSGARLENFYMCPCQVDFLHEDGNISEFFSLLEDLKQKAAYPIKLIVIDTLTRAMAGGDENSGQDMSMLVKHADAIRTHIGAHISFIHHSGKDKARGARGHSSLRAAVDTEIEVSRAEGELFSTMRVVKQRDMDMISPMQFTLERVVLGQNQYDEEVTSCVVSFIATVEITRTKINPKLRKHYDVLCEVVSEKGIKSNGGNYPRSVMLVSDNDFKTALDFRGYLPDDEKSARTMYARFRKELIENCIIAYRKPYLWLVD